MQFNFDNALDSVELALQSKEMNFDDDGEYKNDDLFTQYAKEVTAFSSQYGSETSISYTACNLAGRSNIFPNYGDYTQACVLRTYGPWWNLAPSAKCPFKRTPPSFCSEDFVELLFEVPVYPVRIEIYETYNPGAVIKILACDFFGGTDVDTGTTVWQVLWESPNGPENAARESRKFCPPLRKPDFPTNLIRLEFCHKCCHYYTELDCVLMYGIVPPRSPGPQLSGEVKPLVFPGFQVPPEELELQGVLLNDRKEALSIAQSIEQMKDLSLKDKQFTKETDEKGDHGDDHSENGYFDLLPNEVIQLILSYLDLPSLCRTAMTCSLLHKHCYDPLQYKEVNLQPYWTQVDLHTLDNLHTRCKYLQRLNLSWCESASSVKQHQNFRRFLESCGSELLCLYLACCSFVTSEILRGIADCCPKLKELDLQSCRGVEAGGVSFLCKLKNLQWLNLYRTQVDKNSLIQLIRVSKNLQHLNLGSCARIQNFDEIAIELGKNCKNLKSLDIWRARTITEVGIQALSDNCKQLEELDVGWCADLRSKTGFLVNLVQNCRKLKKIFLTANRSVCDEDLLTIAQYCKDLEQIDILGTRMISKESVYKVLKNCTKLIFFDLSFCEKIDFDTVKQWSIEFPTVDIKKSFQH